jgi:hypothetical protein
VAGNGLHGDEPFTAIRVPAPQSPGPAPLSYRYRPVLWSKSFIRNADSAPRRRHVLHKAGAARVFYQLSK